MFGDDSQQLTIEAKCDEQEKVKFIAECGNTVCYHNSQLVSMMDCFCTDKGC